jgi:hypothetical protein
VFVPGIESPVLEVGVAPIIRRFHRSFGKVGEPEHIALQLIPQLAFALRPAFDKGGANLGFVLGDDLFLALTLGAHRRHLSSM